jgi:hypothetical protein
MLVLPWANGVLEAPAFVLEDTIETSFADTLVRPLDLGWHTTRADITAGFQLYVPTGEYERGGSGNIGKGMWTYEPFVGTTAYFDEKRTVSQTGARVKTEGETLVITATFPVPSVTLQ